MIYGLRRFCSSVRNTLTIKSSNAIVSHSTKVKNERKPVRTITLLKVLFDSNSKNNFY